MRQERRGSFDSHGIHLNSTVFSHGIYLISEGGTTGGCLIRAQGKSVAEQILYRGWTTYFSASVSFNEAYTDLIQAATDLYPAEVVFEVRRALQAVELDQPGTCRGVAEVTPLCQTVSVNGSPRTMSGISSCGPNPTPGSVRLACMLGAPGRVRVAFYDLAGRAVATAVNAWYPAGQYDATWDGTQAGSHRSPGVYFARVTLDGRLVGERRLVMLQ